jgi:hypothetical protein
MVGDEAQSSQRMNATQVKSTSDDRVKPRCQFRAMSAFALYSGTVT